MGAKDNQAKIQREICHINTRLRENGISRPSWQSNPGRRQVYLPPKEERGLNPNFSNYNNPNRIPLPVLEPRGSVHSHDSKRSPKKSNRSKSSKNKWASSPKNQLSWDS